MWRSKFDVPRANILTNIATKNPIIHFTFEFIGNIIAVFDGKKRNTSPCIHLKGFNGFGRTGINTGCAGSAVVGKIGVFNVVKFEVDYYLSDKKERTALFVNQ